MFLHCREDLLWQVAALLWEVCLLIVLTVTTILALVVLLALLLRLFTADRTRLSNKTKIKHNFIKTSYLVHVGRYMYFVTINIVLNFMFEILSQTCTTIGLMHSHKKRRTKSSDKANVWSIRDFDWQIGLLSELNKFYIYYRLNNNCVIFFHLLPWNKKLNV